MLIQFKGFAVSENSSLLIYTPTNGFEGQDSFTYTIEDSEGRQSSATVTLTIKEAVEATGTITALDDAISVAIASSDVLIDVTENDNFGANGPHESHPLTLVNGKFTTASYNGGPISIIDGKVNYTAPANFTGEDTFTYTITDTNGFASSATVTITVGSNESKSNSSSNTLSQNNLTSINSSLENSFSSYPNPTNGYIKTKLYSKTSANGTIVLFDVRGKVVYNNSIQIKEGSNEFELNLNIKSGIVFMKILSSKINYGTSKILIK